MINVKLRDGKGSRQTAELEDNALHVIEKPLPPFSGSQKMRVYRQHLTDDGLPTDGTNQDMSIDGSATSVDFYVEADDEDDIYISVLSFVIADATQTLSEFANSNSALSNGCRLFYKDEKGEVDIHDSLTTNFEFIRLCSGLPSFGDGAAAFRASNVSGASEGYIPTLDLRHTFGFQWGVKLAAGSKQRIAMTIQDDCTAADQFDCIAYGFTRSP